MVRQNLKVVLICISFKAVECLLTISQAFAGNLYPVELLDIFACLVYVSF